MIVGEMCEGKELSITVVEQVFLCVKRIMSLCFVGYVSSPYCLSLWCKWYG